MDNWCFRRVERLPFRLPRLKLRETSSAAADVAGDVLGCHFEHLADLVVRVGDCLDSLVRSRAGTVARPYRR